MLGRIARSICFLCLFLTAGSSLASAQILDQGERASGNGDRILAPVLLVNGGDTPEADQWYHALMDSFFGVGQWDSFDLPEQGLPNPPELLLSLIGQYQGVIWHANATGMENLRLASPVLNDYLTFGADPGRLLLIAPNLYSHLPQMGPLAQEGLGIYPAPSPLPYLNLPMGATALALSGDLPSLTAQNSLSQGTGLQPLEGTEILFQMEYCIRCYSIRPPYDPIVGVRYPDSQTSPKARSITLTLPMHLYTQGQLALETLMKYYLGFIPTTTTDSGVGKARLSINNAGYVGNFFASPDRPSLVYPYPSYVEHLYHGGIWVGARAADGSLRVSTSADSYNTAASGAERREFMPTEDEIVITSNVPGSENYDSAAVAPWQLECSFNDLVSLDVHTPLGLQVNLRALSWDSFHLDDGMVLEYNVINTSGQILRDVYFGFMMDSTVGNTQETSPYNNGTYPSWNYYDDMNGGWRPGDLPDDPLAWMMWEHDDDGDNGFATSWMGCRYLGASHPVYPEAGVAPVSYNAYRFAQFPEFDDEYWDEEDQITLPGRYQIMANGDFDSGVTPDGDFTMVNDWLGLLSTGPVPTFADGDTLRFTYALVCGDGQWELMRNSRRFAELEAADWNLNPSPAPEWIPHKNQLGPAVPNPFNPTTEISFSLQDAGWTQLTVFSLDGRRVKTLVDENLGAGTYHTSWDGRNDAGAQVASGTYFYRMTTAKGHRLIGQMTLLK